jgi:RNA polymerase sigma-70 factor (ECF subfamily)
MAEEHETSRPALRVLRGGAESGPTRPWSPAPARTVSDEALVAAFLVGDDRAFGDLVRRHEKLVLSLVRRYARTPEDARDLAQRTFLRAFEAAHRAVAKGDRESFPFRRWLVRIALNLAKNHLRDELRFFRTSLASLGPREAEPPEQPEALERAQLEARLRRAVARLPRRQREVLTLRIDAELPFAEIAATLEISENAAKVTFHHAARKLRTLVAEEERK